MLKQAYYNLCILVGILLFVGITGCTISLNPQLNSTVEKSTDTLPDPEIGLQMWINAINAKDINRLYILSPNQIREQVTLEQFTEDNNDNYLLKPGYVFTDYTILNETVNQTTAIITAQLNLQMSASQNLNQTKVFPVIYKFFLVFEDGEWKIWNIPLS